MESVCILDIAFEFCAVGGRQTTKKTLQTKT